MGFRRSINAPLHREGHSHIPSRQICTVLRGITLTILANMRVSTFPSLVSQSLTSVGGLFGPMIIHGPRNADYDIDVGPILLTDHYHDEYYDIVKTVMTPLDKGGNPRPSSDNNLINGKMDFDCSTVKPGDKTKCNSNAGISKFRFKTGKVHLLRLSTLR